uniref:PH domain-containing protein n=1 Tax=Steinernema glaseri TaxID=37863 RepID=A0A1I8AAD3_9BILA
MATGSEEPNGFESRAGFSRFESQVFAAGSLLATAEKEEAVAAVAAETETGWLEALRDRLEGRVLITIFRLALPQCLRSRVCFDVIRRRSQCRRLLQKPPNLLGWCIESDTLFNAFFIGDVYHLGQVGECAITMSLSSFLPICWCLWVEQQLVLLELFVHLTQKIEPEIVD